MQSIMPTFQRFLVVELQMAQFSRALGETFIRAPAVIATPRLRISDNFSTKMELSLPIIKDIIHWLFSPSNEERILWLGHIFSSFLISRIRHKHWTLDSCICIEDINS